MQSKVRIMMVLKPKILGGSFSGWIDQKIFGTGYTILKMKMFLIVITACIANTCLNACTSVCPLVDQTSCQSVGGVCVPNIYPASCGLGFSYCCEPVGNGIYCENDSQCSAAFPYCSKGCYCVKSLTTSGATNAGSNKSCSSLVLYGSLFFAIYTFIWVFF